MKERERVPQFVLAVSLQLEPEICSNSMSMEPLGTSRRLVMPIALSAYKLTDFIKGELLKPFGEECEFLDFLKTLERKFPDVALEFFEDDPVEFNETFSDGLPLYEMVCVAKLEHSSQAIGSPNGIPQKIELFQNGLYHAVLGEIAKAVSEKLKRLPEPNGIQVLDQPVIEEPICLGQDWVLYARTVKAKLEQRLIKQVLEPIEVLESEKPRPRL